MIANHSNITLHFHEFNCHAYGNTTHQQFERYPIAVQVMTVVVHNLPTRGAIKPTAEECQSLHESTQQEPALQRIARI